MTRPTRLIINARALSHNLKRVKQLAPGKKVVAMVKANAYGCGLNVVIPLLDERVDAFGVASLEEALVIRSLGSHSEIILFQGVFDPDEYTAALANKLSCVIHQPHQLEWLLNQPLSNPIKIWIKVNTGMNRLGFMPQDLSEINAALKQCPWVDQHIGLMTHFASADELNHPQNVYQKEQCALLDLKAFSHFSTANSAVIFNDATLHADWIRPGIMLYGVSPFANQNGQELGLMPVMKFQSEISAIHTYPAHSPVGYGGVWESDKPAVIGIVPVGYGDGYPRSIDSNACVWVNGYRVPIVGRVSMDMMAIDLTQCHPCNIGDDVELWGPNIPVEEVARSSGTIAYELLCRVSERVRR